MRQAILTSTIILIIASLLAAVVLGSRSKKTKTQASPQALETNSPPVTQSPISRAPIFFYGNTCPHCAEVEVWMKENKIEEKIEIIKKEVYDNQDNFSELLKTAKKCGLSTNTIGVPFLYTPEGRCLIGTPEVTAYLSDKAGISDNLDEGESGKEGKR